MSGRPTVRRMGKRCAAGGIDRHGGWIIKRSAKKAAVWRKPAMLSSSPNFSVI